LPFAFEPEELFGLDAFEKERLDAVRPNPKDREAIGDRLGLAPKKLPKGVDSEALVCWFCFPLSR
jgi:hypothetical protein